MTVLLTGATGFVGRHLLALLAGEGEEVVAIARDVPPPDLAPHATWLRGDLAAGLDPAALPRSVDIVVHLAQSDRYRDFPEGAGDVVAVNVDAVAALADHARRTGARRFVLCSTGGVYGFGAGPAREDDPVAPVGFYPASKYAAELLLGAYGSLFETVILRPFFVYGAGQRRMLVAGLAERVLRGDEVTIDGDPGLRINPIHVADAARAIAAASRPGAATGVVNVAGDRVVALTELVRGLAVAAGVAPRIVHAGDGPAGDLVGDTARMRDEFGVAPEVSLEQGLRGVVDELRAGRA